MVDYPSLALAFTAGVFTVFSPCSFPLLPGYFSYRLTVSSSRWNAVASGIVCALGLISVFCLIAILLSLAGAILSSFINSLPLLAGVIIVAMGVLVLAGRQLSHTPLALGVSKKHSLLGTFAYGIAYGFASTACSAPIFYSVVLYALTSKGLAEGGVAFAFYSLGIGVPLVVFSVLIAFGRYAVVHRFSKATPILRRVSGILLIGFGLYQVYSYLSSP